jgi:release factor glutamine methyltransferase
MTVNNFVNLYKTQLSNLYSGNEISGIINLVFEKILNIKGHQIVLEKDKILSETKSEKLQHVLNRLYTGEPVQYILEEADFFSLKFYVNSSVLIPRQETEELVKWIIDNHGHLSGLNILDIGTGSGCIAISLCKNLDKPEIYAADISDKALSVTEYNSRKNETQINTILTDVLNIDTYTKLYPTNFFDIIVSNPPYIEESEKISIHKNVTDYEPPEALFVRDDNPLIFYRNIISLSKKILKPGAFLYFEINENSGVEVMDILRDNNFSRVELRKDINNKDRMVKGQI